MRFLFQHGAFHGRNAVERIESSSIQRIRGFPSRNWSACVPTRSGQVGFVGLGQMGSPMAMNLIASGYNLVVFDIDPANANKLKEKLKEKERGRGGSSVGGAFGDVLVVHSPGDVARRCTSIVTMLPSTPHVESVYLGEHGILEAVQEGSLLIDSSTIEPLASKRIADVFAKEKKSRMIDAPVSGGVNGAAAGTLTFMVGGTEKAVELARPLLSCMGKNIVHCGPESTGQAAKLCNNLALAIEMIAVSEAMILGTQLGIDPKVLAGYNPYPGVMENVPASKNYEGGFASVLMRKDLGLALDAAKSVEASVPFTASAYQLYNMIVKAGEGKKDFSTVLKFLKGKQ